MRAKEHTVRTNRYAGSFSALILLFSLAVNGYGQQGTFGDRCLGIWTGQMYIYAGNTVRDSVPVRLEVAKTADSTAWSWRTEYLSEKMPVTKDYVLRVKDAAKGWYITDEGGGVELHDYLFGNKLYTVFDVEGILLTSTYEWLGDQLIFEVTSGKQIQGGAEGLRNFSVNNLQRVVFKKQ